MKPKLGTKVYCIYNDGFFVDTVGYLGKESFIINGFGGSTEEDSWEWNYDKYGQSWFINISEAKDKLFELYKDEYDAEESELIVKKINEDWYQIVDLNEE